MSEDHSGLDTFPKLLMHHAKARPARPAIREKDLGIWQTWTWHQLADEVRALASALASRGFTRGEHFAIVGDNRPRVYAAMCAAQALGGIPVTLYQDAEHFVVLRPERDLLAQPIANETRDGWNRFAVPLAGGAGWTREGAVLTQVQWLTLGFDSWGAPPLMVWIDGLGFR